VPRTEPTRIFRKVGWQRIPLYPYLTRPLTEIEAADPGQKLRNDAERIFAGLRRFAQFLKDNVDDSSASFGQNRAVNAQWRAIVMLDAEIRKYQPNYQWFNRPIQEALAKRQKGSRP
jgi:hypothetical protein